MTREEGYYWVKSRQFGWEICLWEPDHFVTCGYGWQYDEDFDEIDENRITREEKKDVYPACSSPQRCNYTGECQQSFVGGKCKHHKEGHKY